MLTNRGDYNTKMLMIHKINVDFIILPCIGLDRLIVVFIPQTHYTTWEYVCVGYN
jgi:hypothetical protein